MEICTCSVSWGLAFLACWDGGEHPQKGHQEIIVVRLFYLAYDQSSARVSATLLQGMASYSVIFVWLGVRSTKLKLSGT